MICISLTLYPHYALLVHVHVHVHVYIIIAGECLELSLFTSFRHNGVIAAVMAVKQITQQR